MPYERLKPATGKPPSKTLADQLPSQKKWPMSLEEDVDVP